MSIVRDAILRELERRGKTRHWLIQQTGMSNAVVYNFLTGKRDMSLANVERIMQLLGLKVCSPSDSTPDTTRRPRKAPKPH